MRDITVTVYPYWGVHGPYAPYLPWSLYTLILQMKRHARFIAS